MLLFVTKVYSFDLQSLSSECLNGTLSQRKIVGKLQCVTSSKGVRVLKLQEKNQTIYCINYEKKTGDITTFDVLSFDLNDEDYELFYVSKK